MRYRVMDGDKEITQGDTVISFRGEPWTFEYVTRGPESGMPKVYVTWMSDSREFYLSVFPGLSVVTTEN